MKTSDLDQMIDSWADGTEPMPDLNTIKTMAAEIGARRTKARQIADDEGARLRKLLVAAYIRTPWRNITDMMRVSGLSRMTINDDLTEAGIKPGLSRAAQLDKIDDAA